MRKDSVMKIILPGWGIPKEEYSVMGADHIVDYGFFDNNNAVLDLMDADTWLNNLVPDHKYVIIAHSMGTLFALRNSQLRNQAEHIYLFGGFAKFTESEDNPYGKPDVEVVMMQKQLKRNPELLLKRFYRSVAAPESIKISLPNVLNVAQLISGLELLRSDDIRNELSGIDVPVSILHGAKDAIVSPELAKYLRNNIDNAVLDILDDIGHAVAFTQHERLLNS